MKGVLFMNNPYILFRRAEIEEVETIWDILHSQSVSWDDAMIVKNLPRLFLLLIGQKIIGILHCSDLNSMCIEWIAVHPRYPEKMFRELMLDQLHSFVAVNGEKPVKIKRLSSSTANGF